MPWFTVIPQIASCITGLCLGGNSTKLGGCLLLASVWLFGAGIGWLIRKGRVERMLGRAYGNTPTNHIIASDAPIRAEDQALARKEWVEIAKEISDERKTVA